MPRSAVSPARTRLRLEALEGRANPVALDAAFAVGDAGEWAKDVAADAAGNTYVVGLYNRTVDFDRSDADPATNPHLVLTSASYPNPNSPTGTSPYQEGFAAKYDPTGACVWAVPLGRGGFSSAEEVALDLRPGSRGVLVTGAFPGSCDFGGVALTSSGAQDAFVARLDDATGAVQWARQWGGAYEHDAGYGVAVDAAGNAYATGRLNLTPGSTNNNFDAYVAKYDPAGAVVWARQFGGPASANGNYDYGTAVSVDAAGGVFVGGNFRGTADFDPGAGTFSLASGGRSADPSTAGFVVKLSQAAGAFAWAAHFQADQWAGSSVADVVADPATGGVYAVGNFSGKVDFNPDKKAALNLTGTSDGFAVKLTPQGQLGWARAFGGDSNFDVYGAAVDAAGGLYLTGSFRGAVDLDPGSATFSRTSAGEEDVFVMKLTAAGSFAWGAAMGGTGADRGQGVAVDGAGNVYAVGFYTGPADFDPASGVAFDLPATPGYALFWVKLTQT